MGEPGQADGPGIPGFGGPGETAGPAVGDKPGERCGVRACARAVAFHPVAAVQHPVGLAGDLMDLEHGLPVAGPPVVEAQPEPGQTAQRGLVVVERAHRLTSPARVHSRATGPRVWKA